MILSASRRTDIPAYYSEWFVNRLKEGHVVSRNPMNHSQVSKIILSPDIVDCIVFWSKDPRNIMSSLPLIDDMGYSYYFQFTLTPYDKMIEPNLRDKKLIIETFMDLSKTIGKNKVVWRYDPIILNDRIDISYHIEKFSNLCEILHPYTNVVVISFVDLYSKLRTKLIRDISENETAKLSRSFKNIASKFDLHIKACCEKMDLSLYGIEKASCIDKSLIEEILNCKITAKTDRNQRRGCGCIESVDIGAYNTCKNGCVYCYANYSKESVAENCSKHDPLGDILIGKVGKDEKITERKAVSLKDNSSS